MGSCPLVVCSRQLYIVYMTLTIVEHCDHMWCVAAVAHRSCVAWQLWRVAAVARRSCGASQLWCIAAVGSGL